MSISVLFYFEMKRMDGTACLSPTNPDRTVVQSVVDGMLLFHPNNDVKFQRNNNQAKFV
jgi:hypothetical protein